MKVSAGDVNAKIYFAKPSFLFDGLHACQISAARILHTMCSCRNSLSQKLVLLLYSCMKRVKI